MRAEFFSFNGAAKPASDAAVSAYSRVHAEMLKWQPAPMYEYSLAGGLRRFSLVHY